MKKILFMAVSAVLLVAGCQKTEIQNESLTPIGFGTHMGKLTKVGPDAENDTPKGNLIEQRFHVWGFFAGKLNDPNYSDLNYDLGELYLDNITVYTEDDGANWSTGETYYWPGKEKELDIYAISSYDDVYSLAYVGTGDSRTCNVEIDYEEKKVKIKDFIADSDADNDLMVAPMIKQDQDDAKEITPAFQHALTKIVVKFREKGDSDVWVKSAKTSPIKSKATLEVTNTLPTQIPTSGPVVCTAGLSWTYAEGPVVTEYEAQCKEQTESVTDVTDQSVHNAVKLKEMVEAVKDEDGNITTPGNDGYITYGCWLLIPQDDITGYYLDVEYIIDGMLIEQRFKLDTVVKAWGANQQITYNVTISPDYIEFAPEIDEWITDENPVKEENYNS